MKQRQQKEERDMNKKQKREKRKGVNSRFLVDKKLDLEDKPMVFDEDDDEE